MGTGREFVTLSYFCTIKCFLKGKALKRMAGGGGGMGRLAGSVGGACDS